MILRVRVTACTASSLPAFIVKHTRERNKKLKAVDKICLKLCTEWRSDWLFVSLKSAALILHRSTEKGRTRFSVLISWLPLECKAELITKPFQGSFICQNLKLSVVLLNTVFLQTFFLCELPTVRNHWYIWLRCFEILKIYSHFFLARELIRLSLSLWIDLD